MKKTTTCVALATAAMLSAPIAGAETYYMHGFFGLATIQPTTGPNVIEYPNTDWYWGRGIRQGETNLDNQIGSLPPGSTVMGISEGSIVVRNWLRDHAGDPDAPSPDDVKFVLAAPPLLPGGLIYTVLPEGTWLPIAEQTIEPMPVTPYDIDVVRMEYDGWADFPKYWYVNPLADANAITGMFYEAHGSTPTNPDVYQTVPHYSETNAAGGTTTNYLAPNPVLPLTDPFRQVGVPDALVDEVDNVLRPIIDMGYDRSSYVNASEPTSVETPVVESPDASTLDNTLTSVTKEDRASARASKVDAAPESDTPTLGRTHVASSVRGLVGRLSNLAKLADR